MYYITTYNLLQTSLQSTNQGFRVSMYLLIITAYPKQKLLCSSSTIKHLKFLQSTHCDLLLITSRYLHYKKAHPKKERAQRPPPPPASTTSSSAGVFGHRPFPPGAERRESGRRRRGASTGVS